MPFTRIGLVALSFALMGAYGPVLDSSPRQFTGVWLYEFEGSTFVEGATAIPPHRPAYRETDWLTYRFDQPRLETLVEHWAYDEERGCYPVQPFRVTFIGERSIKPGGSGHLGLWRSEVTVHETISFERLGPSFCY